VHRDRYSLHVTLFVLTFVSTGLTTSLTFIGRSEAWAVSATLFTVVGFPFSTAMLLDSLVFACCLLFFLTAHEFGHYIAARCHGVRTSLPYYIPAPLIGIGTMGAVISIREPLPSTRKVFDIGVAGPIAGFVVALPLLLYAMITVPPPEYLFGVSSFGHEVIHNYIREYGSFPPMSLEASDGTRLTIGTTPLYWGLSQLFADIPPMYEMYHYPVLFAAWLGLFFTALNLMPVGQLDGGHIVYALVGPRWHLCISQGFIILLLTSMAIGAAQDGPSFMTTLLPNASSMIHEMGTWIILALLLQLFLRRVLRHSGRRWLLPIATAILVVAMLGRLAGGIIAQFGYTGWLLWCVLLIFLIKVEHPPVARPSKLSRRRTVLGIAALVIFVLCFSIKPLHFV